MTLTQVLARIKEQFDWRGPSGRAMGHIVMEREEAFYLHATVQSSCTSWKSCSMSRNDDMYTAEKLRASAKAHAELGASDLICKAELAADEIDRLEAEVKRLEAENVRLRAEREQLKALVLKMITEDGLDDHHRARRHMGLKRDDE